LSDPALLADALERLRASPEPWAAEVVRDLAARPAVARELHRRRVWSEAARIFDQLLAGGASTREAAQTTRRRLLALGLDAPHWNTIRQTLLRQRVEARTAGMGAPRCSVTAADPTI
jgi:stalled ribosome alternative rescue factor ArfA